MTWYEVNYADVAYNYKTIAERTGALVVPMLKANAYGLDAVQTAQALREAGVGIFAVSRLEEALAFARPEDKIWVLSCYHDPKALETLIENDFVLAADSLEQCRVISELAEKAGKTATVHIAVDTGFGRFGFAPNEISDILAACELSGLQAEGIFSHLGAAFFPKDKLADRQLEIFLSVVNALGERGRTFSLRHIAASAGFARDPKFHLDAVRVGSALCGRMPMRHGLPLRKVGKLYSEIIDIRTVPKGTYIGYGKVYKLKRSARVAVLAAGSADGVGLRKDYDAFRLRDFLRYGKDIVKMMLRRDNRMRVRLESGSAPVLGRVALTHTMIDVTGLDCKVGDRAEIPISPLFVADSIRRMP